jgi:hypothetical protein
MADAVVRIQLEPVGMRVLRSLIAPFPPRPSELEPPGLSSNATVRVRIALLDKVLDHSPEDGRRFGAYGPNSTDRWARPSKVLRR